MKILITGGKGNIATIIFNHLQNIYKIENPSHEELDLLNFDNISNYLNDKSFDILVHTAILGGRRTTSENYDIVYKNLLMFENLMKFSNKFKMIINLDSAAIYDRSTDIMNRKEYELFSIPTDYYGFSKYIIYQRSLNYSHLYNFRIFNIFHANEEPNRFIKSCFLAKENKTEITIFEDKYFDFVYEDDFIIVLKHYIDSVGSPKKLEKTINICYNEKIKLSEIAKIIIEDENKIITLNNDMKHNYCGNNDSLKEMNIKLNGLENGLYHIESKIHSD